MGLTGEQRLCVETLDRPLAVAAGAGSGKTFTLTKRISHALESSCLDDIGEVCAITFTKKAAGELKSRVKGELRASGLVEQALKVDEAWISTIHGMCSRILRAHAIELGINPKFSVVEGAAVGEYLDLAVDTVLLEAQLDGSSQQIDALFEEYPARSQNASGTSVEGMLRSLVETASTQAGGVDSLVMPGVTVEPRAALDAIVGVVDDLRALAEVQKENASRNSWLFAAETLVDEARAMCEQVEIDPLEVLELVEPFKLAKNFGSKQYKIRVEEARGELAANVMEIRLGMARSHLDTLVGLARRALEVYGQLKRADGVLDNSDLLVLTARAIEEHPSIAARYADKFKLIMVDEFQDTDQMQVDMIARLAGEGARRLCVVGDAQQSIYRFRGADVSVYRRHLESVSSAWGDASIIKLSQNFRSHPDVLAFVDCVFGKSVMFGDEFMSLSAGREEARVESPLTDGRARIVVQHTATPPSSRKKAEAAPRASTDDARTLAARRIAREFAELAKAGHSPGEMVVLLGGMPHADVYAKALRDVGLPCVISGGSVFSSSLEANAIRSLVRVIANPRETQALFSVLTSPLFGLAAGDLLAVDGLKGFWKATRADGGAPESADDDAVEGAGGSMPENADDNALESADGCAPEVQGERSSRLTCALRVMGAARAAAGKEPVSHIVERIATDSGWLSRLERGGAEGLASAGNVMKAIRMIRDLEQAGTAGPVMVMRQFEETLDNAKVAPGALSVSGGDSVRIMTVHASKGLEFPIVAVAEIKENRKPTSKLLSASIDGKTYLSLDLNRKPPENFEEASAYVLGPVVSEEALARAVADEAGALHRRFALREYMAAGEVEEAKRLLYVAITRAKEAVVVSSLGRCTKDNPLGIPSSALAGIFGALQVDSDMGGAAFESGRSPIDFGGSMPAYVECVIPRVAEGDDGEGGEAGSPTDSKVFPVPADEPVVVPIREAWRPLREGVFSYSSISDASHEGDILRRLADAYAVSVDGATGEGDPFDLSATVAQALQSRAPRIVSNDEGDDFWAIDPSEAFDSDRATDLGTAFHRLAQYAVVTRAEGEDLALPPKDRVDALSRTCNLDGLQRDRLNRALDRWFGSNVAREMAALPQLSAEVPFFVSVDGAYLEGEIDLIGFNERGSHAYVVDYKTGGSDSETADDLREKHVLQAACYAYAVMLQGADAVDAVFVRVERAHGDDADQPQCVRYRFESSDLPALESAIGAVYAAR